MHNFHFIVGSQDLYGGEVLRQVDEHSKIMADGFTQTLPYAVHWTPVVRNSAEIEAAIAAANHDPHCAGIITWMHTFSPSKMWIRGLTRLQKPLLHLNTQFNKAIPWDSIDMDFMNLNQSAHGDREHGYITARLRLPRTVLAGHWQCESLQQRVAQWQRAAVGVAESRKLRVLRISDNMRDVAVTEGDKVQAHIQFGWQVDYYGVGDIVTLVEAVTPDEIAAQMAEYRANYEFATEDIAAIEYQAKMQVALQKFMQDEDFGAFHTNFQDLQQLRQLPGLAAQDLMRQGFGFAGEGDWKTAALCRMMKRMAADLPGGTGFMEDYTYDLERGLNMGAHMLEVCPTFAATKPQIHVAPLGIGDREPPARLTFKAQAGEAILATIVDMGDRFRMIVNDVQCVQQPHDMPKLPVAAVLWKPLPSLETSAEAWILAGGAHHSVLSYGLDAETMRHFAEMLNLEFVHIGAHTSIPALRQELRYNDVIWKG
ncbi:MAG: L-arabinose isomerase [Oscillospiraceae bacterium]|nr:L-arabinose isomerase [Oscillospiraceae bacterium]